MAESDNNNIESLLPFYVNGTLDNDETALVEQALANHPELQQEVLFLQNLREHVKQQEFDHSPGELGLKRLQKTIAAESRSQQKQPSSTNFWRLTTVAACLMLVVQTVIVNYESESPYTAAGGKTTTIDQGQIISVTFTPNVTEQALRQFLLETDARIIDGPSALGIYHLSVPDKLTDTDIVAIFNTRPDIIESVQKEP